jgi:hypothetical protein
MFPIILRKDNDKVILPNNIKQLVRRVMTLHASCEIKIDFLNII